MSITVKMRNNLDTVRTLSLALQGMDESNPYYYPYADRIAEAKANIINEVNGKEVSEEVESFLMNNFSSFMKSTFTKKELTGLL